MAVNLQEFEITLPIGYKDENHAVHRRATIRKMNGHDEALLEDPNLNSGQLVTGLIKNCLVKLGDLESIQIGIVSQLYTADRNFILLELRKITFGNTMSTSYQCPRCNYAVSVLEDLDKLGVKSMHDGEILQPIDLTLEDGYIDRKGSRHSEIEVTLPNGEDEEFISQYLEDDPLNAEEIMMLRCIQKFGDLPKAEIEAYGQKILRDLTLGDRRKLQKAFISNTPGVDFQRNIQCDSCGAQFSGILDVSNFFLN